MKLSLSKNDFLSYVSSQLNNFFPDQQIVKLVESGNLFDLAIDRTNYCFSKVSFERYNKNNQTLLNHLYSDHYLVFLWFLSNTFWKENGDLRIATKLYYLNKALHAFDCMYDTGLPDVFLIFHGSGTMLGKATYKDYFVAFQGCTVGAHKGKYPSIGTGVTLTAHSSVVGDSNIGDRVSISLNTTIFQRNVPSDCVIYLDNGNIVQRNSSPAFAQQFFNVDLSSIQ